MGDWTFPAATQLQGNGNLIGKGFGMNGTRLPWLTQTEYLTGDFFCPLKPRRVFSPRFFLR
jgi:hypothetical protein